MRPDEIVLALVALGLMDPLHPHLHPETEAPQVEAPQKVQSYLSVESSHISSDFLGRNPGVRILRLG